jgi:hypothetical protein
VSFVNWNMKRAPNIRLAAYLDDWFVVNQNKQMLMEDREKTLNLLINLGFIVNLEKSNLIPGPNLPFGLNKMV